MRNLWRALSGVIPDRGTKIGLAMPANPPHAVIDQIAMVHAVLLPWTTAMTSRPHFLKTFYVRTKRFIADVWNIQLALNDWWQNRYRKRSATNLIWGLFFYRRWDKSAIKDKMWLPPSMTLLVHLIDALDESLKGFFENAPIKMTAAKNERRWRVTTFCL